MLKDGFLHHVHVVFVIWGTTYKVSFSLDTYIDVKKKKKKKE